MGFEVVREVIDDAVDIASGWTVGESGGQSATRDASSGLCFTVRDVSGRGKRGNAGCALLLIRGREKGDELWER